MVAPLSEAPLPRAVAQVPVTTLLEFIFCASQQAQKVEKAPYIHTLRKVVNMSSRLDASLIVLPPEIRVQHLRETVSGARADFEGPRYHEFASSSPKRTFAPNYSVFAVCQLVVLTPEIHPEEWGVTRLPILLLTVFPGSKQIEFYEKMIRGPQLARCLPGEDFAASVSESVRAFASKLGLHEDQWLNSYLSLIVIPKQSLDSVKAHSLYKAMSLRWITSMMPKG
jgi:hypothetical protein